jgi:hypothetical protein
MIPEVVCTQRLRRRKFVSRQTFWLRCRERGSVVQVRVGVVLTPHSLVLEDAENSVRSV